MAEELDLTPVAELRQLLTDQGIRNAQDPGDLTPPGVLVKVTAWDRYTLGGPMRPTVQLYAVVPSGNHERVTAALVANVNQLLELVDPDGPVLAVSVNLPDAPAPLPALTFPVNLI